MTQHILFEINEICPPLIERFIQQGIMPNFEKYKSLFNRYLTQADAESPALEPWIQWYSLHTGLPYEQHQVFRLREGSRAGHPDIWTKIRGYGYKVMNFSSMNTAALTNPEDVFFPDPWSNNKANPISLQPIADFIASQVQEYTAPNQKIDYVEFGKTLLKHGLGFGTIKQAVTQLFSEKMKDNKNKYKRIFILDGILMDLFFHYHRKTSPDFATFFTNSVAHIQHAYWRYFEPEKFQAQIHRPEFTYAVQDAYENMDYRFGQLMSYAQKHNIRVSVASALSQRPYLKDEHSGGRHYYRPREITKLLQILGISPLTCEPVMTHQYILTFKNNDDKAQALRVLQSSRLLDDHHEDDLFTVKNADIHDGLIFDCKPRTLVSQQANAVINNQSYGFSELFYLIDEIKSGGHDPIGLFWQQVVTPNQQGADIQEPMMVYDVFHKLLEPFTASTTRA